MRRTTTTGPITSEQVADRVQLLRSYFDLINHSVPLFLVNANHGTVLGVSGYLRVRVSPEEVNVDYVQTYPPGEEDETHRDGMVADSYTIKAGTD